MEVGEVRAEQALGGQVWLEERAVNMVKLIVMSLMFRI